MNMLREFFNYFISVMMGHRDSLTAFLEPLTMGERYLRWGVGSRDIRDFRSAMDHLHLCHDRDAPMASLLIRKYNCIGDITTSAIETLLMRHNKVIEDAVKTENNYREELALLIKKVADGKDYIRKLQEEGSLIKAKTEESRVTELESNIQHLKEMLDTGEGKTEVYESYDEITSDANRFFRELDHASSMVLANELLGQSGAEALAGQLRGKLDHLRDRLEKANPILSEKQAAAAPAASAPRPGQTGGAARPKGGR